MCLENIILLSLPLLETDETNDKKFSFELNKILIFYNVNVKKLQ